MRRKKSLTVFEYELPIVIKKDKTSGFVATCPVWSDCYAQGDTIEEAINEISYVASSLVELYQEEEMKVPLALKKTKEEKEGFFEVNFPLFVTGSYA